MEAFSDQHHLVDAQAIADVTAYVSQLRPLEASGHGSGELLVHGAESYANACASCHGGAGEGDAEQAVPGLAAQHLSICVVRSMTRWMVGARTSRDSTSGYWQNWIAHDIGAICDYLSRLGAGDHSPRFGDPLQVNRCVCAAKPVRAAFTLVASGSENSQRREDNQGFPRRGHPARRPTYIAAYKYGDLFPLCSPRMASSTRDFGGAMKVGTICQRLVSTVNRSDEVSAAARLMRDAHVGYYLVVVQTVASGRAPHPIGVLTDRDLVVMLLARDVTPSAVSVGDVMTANPVTIRESDSIEDCPPKDARARGSSYAGRRRAWRSHRSVVHG